LVILQKQCRGGWTKIVQYDEDAYTPTSGAAGFIATQMVGDGKLSDEEIDMIGGKRVLLNVGSVIGGSRNSFSLFDNVNDDLPLSRLTGRYVGLSITIGAESRVITSYVVANPGANPAIVVSPDFVALPTSGATYEIYSPTKEYLLFGVSFTGLTDNVEEPIYRLYMRSSFPYVDTAYGQGILSDTGAAVGACYAGAYQDCPASWAYFISPGRIDTAEFGFAAGSPGAVDDCNRIVTDVNPNYCLVRHNSLVSGERAVTDMLRLVVRCLLSGCIYFMHSSSLTLSGLAVQISAKSRATFTTVSPSFRPLKHSGATFQEPALWASPSAKAFVLCRFPYTHVNMTLRRSQRRRLALLRRSVGTFTAGPRIHKALDARWPNLSASGVRLTTINQVQPQSVEPLSLVPSPGGTSRSVPYFHTSAHEHETSS